MAISQQLPSIPKQIFKTVQLEKRLRIIEKNIATISTRGGTGGSSGGGSTTAGSDVLGAFYTGSTSTTLTLPAEYASGSIRLYKNNLRLKNTAFTETTATTITLTDPRLTDDEIIIDFSTAADNRVFGELHTGSTSAVITLDNAYVTDSIILFKNNARLPNTAFTQTSSTTVTLTAARTADDEFLFDYLKP